MTKNIHEILFCRPTPTITPSKCLCIKGLSDVRCCPNRYQTGTKEVTNRYYWGVVRLAFALYLYLADFCCRYFHQRYLLGTCLLPVCYLFCEQVPCLKRPVYRPSEPKCYPVRVILKNLPGLINERLPAIGLMVTDTASSFPYSTTMVSVCSIPASLIFSTVVTL